MIVLDHGPFYVRHGTVKISENANARSSGKANYLIDSIQSVLVQHYGGYMGLHLRCVYLKQWQYAQYGYSRYLIKALRKQN